LTTPIQPGCEYVCVNKSATGGSTTPDFSVEFKECKYPCQTQNYRCDASNQICIYNNTDPCNLRCKNRCDPATACLAAPCSVDVAGKDCVGRLVMGTTKQFVCKDNYCGGCKAEWYVEGVRVCQDAVNCNACPTACPATTDQVFDPFTGCAKCGVCKPKCPAYNCLLACPLGNVPDENGCPTCNCTQCPPLLTCNLDCANVGYVVDPVTRCKKCACNVNPCPQVLCAHPCPYGFGFDPVTNCPNCDCVNCTKPACPANVFCINGFKNDATTRCPTCDCIPTCRNYCPLGYVDAYFSATATTVNAETCKCRCDTSVTCGPCPDGYVIDIYGCKTCKCIEKYPTPICPKIACSIFCKYGHVIENGCPICKCNPTPNCTEPVCPALANCIYGTVEENGCKTCKCLPCPEVKCALYCPFGYARDDKTGCPTCQCNPNPKCLVASTATDIAAICPLDCATTGFYFDKDHCPQCNCNPVKPCECPTFVAEKPILCKDGRTESVITNVCARSDANVCYYVRTSCPYGFTVELPKGSVLTDADIAKIKAVVGVTDSDIVIEKQASTDPVKYIIWVKKEGLPPTKSATDVNSQIGTTVKEDHSGAEAFIFSDGSTPDTGFGYNLVPMVGLFLAVLFFI
jgi:hypothetical protein